MIMTVLLLFAILVALPATVAFFSEPRRRYRWLNSFTVGTPVVYREYGMSTRPISGAHDIHPAEHGDFYYYSTINYLRVADVFDDGAILAVSRNRQCIYLDPNDRNLRKARWTERVIYRPRFPRI